MSDIFKSDKSGMKRIACFFALIVLFSGTVSAHKFYVSLCRIDINDSTKSLELSFRIFADDLEYGIFNKKRDNIIIGSAKEPKNTDQLISEYIKKNVLIKLNRKEAISEMKYIGKEVESDVCWVYVEIPFDEKIGELSIYNHLLIERFPEQVNIVHVNFKEHTRSLLLKKGHASGSVSI